VSVGSYRRFEGFYCLYLHSKAVQKELLFLECVKSVNIYKRRAVILQKASIVKEEWLIVTVFWAMIYRSLGGANTGTNIRISTVVNSRLCVKIAYCTACTGRH